ncbi:MAG: hypothetical protein SGPRY_010471 [Prymnesium sp.]
MESAFTKAFKAIDVDFLQEARAEQLGDGTTVLCTLLQGNTLHIANVGDSRAVLGRRPDSRPSNNVETGGRCLRDRDPEAVRLSVDHKPDVAEESRRIHEQGGLVRCVNGCWRVVSAHAQTM